jgi:Flp pilus assembly pilin Flp
MSNLMVALYARVTSAALALRDEEKGQAMVEYGLVLVLVALVAAVAFTTLGGNLFNSINGIAGKL